MDYQHTSIYRLSQLRKEIGIEIQRRRGKKSQHPAYGLLNKGFTAQEFELLLGLVTSDQARLIFRLQAYLGLRIGEACSLRRQDFDLPGRRLWVQSAKGSYPALFPLLDNLYPYLEEWVLSGRSGEEWLFPSKNRMNRHAHTSPGWAAKELREARKKAGLDMVYGLSLPGGAQRRPRPLYRLSTHSLRHLFITTVHNKIGDLLVTQKLARHRDIKSTIRYTFKSQEQLHEALVSVYR